MSGNPMSDEAKVLNAGDKLPKANESDLVAAKAVSVDGETAPRATEPSAATLERGTQMAERAPSPVKLGETAEELANSAKGVAVAKGRSPAGQSERLPGPRDSQDILRDPLAVGLEMGCFTASMNLLTRRDLALQATEGRGHVLAANDYDFMLRMAKFGPFAFVDRITIRCDRRDDGISHTRGALQAGYAVLAASDAVAFSETHQPAFKADFAHRRPDVPAAFHRRGDPDFRTLV